MSSLNDTSDYNVNSSSAYSDTIDDNQTGDNTRTEDQTSFSPSRISASDVDLVTGSFSDEDGQFYDDEFYSGYDSRTYDSRTYDTRTYDDSSIPQSPRSDELSSTFASFYLEGETARKVRSTISFLFKPLIFFSFALSGSGGIGAMCHVVYAVTIAAAQRRISKQTSTEFNNLNSLPEGYSNMPEWMQKARISLPSVVESFVKKVLQITGIPSLADLQKERWMKAMEGFKRTKSEVISQATYVTSGPMVPLAVFLPLFSVTVMCVARYLAIRQQARLQEEEEENDFDLDLLAATDMDGIPFLHSLDTSQIPAEISPPVDLLLDKEKKQEENGIKMNRIKINNNINGEEDSTLLPEKGIIGMKQSQIARAPSESQTNPHTVPTSRDLSPISSMHEDVFKTAQNNDREEVDTSFSPSLASSLPRSLNLAPYSLKGDIVAALVGEPSLNEVNVLLIAAARYNCRKLILPSSIPASSLLSVAPSLSVQRVEDVMQYVMTVEEPRGLTTIGVFLRPVTDNIIELPLFIHPTAAVYIFTSAKGSDEGLVAHLVDKCIFTSSSLDEPIPANACFYDRSVKERSGVEANGGF